MSRYGPQSWEVVETLPETVAEAVERRVWVTKNQRVIPYEELPVEHLENILACFDGGTMRANLWAHEPGLREEHLENILACFDGGTMRANLWAHEPGLREELESR